MGRQGQEGEGMIRRITLGLNMQMKIQKPPNRIDLATGRTACRIHIASSARHAWLWFLAMAAFVRATVVVGPGDDIEHDPDCNETDGKYL
jgi:hypothetical protein